MGTVRKFDMTPISFGGQSADAQLQYNGFPYALDFSLSVITPSRLTVSFIAGEQGKDSPAAGGTKTVAAVYDYTLLNTDIKAGVSQDPKVIYYCGKKFMGYPLKYSIKRSSSGDILSVDYYDASIGYLDNTLVLLNDHDVPPVAENPDVGDDYAFWSLPHPCPEKLWLMGQRYQKALMGKPFEGGSTKCNIDKTTATSYVLYSNLDLSTKLKTHLRKGGDTLIDLASLDSTLLRQEDGEVVMYYEAFHGTLRDVLKQWGDKLGFSFYWETDNPAFLQGRLVFFNLREGVTSKKVATTVQKTLEACNLLDRSESITMEDTFNKAIVARYSNDALAEFSREDSFIFLDFLSLPVMGCHTSTDEVGQGGNTKYKSVGDYPGNTFGDVKREEEPDWYAVWDDANYSPKTEAGADPSEKELRTWQMYQPTRPDPSAGPPPADDPGLVEFRDYVRLVKAAALGADFFKAYVFFKSLAENPSWRGNFLMTVKEYMDAQNVTQAVDGSLEGPGGPVAGTKYPSVAFYIQEVQKASVRVLKDNVPLTALEIQALVAADKDEIETRQGAGAKVPLPNNAELLACTLRASQVAAGDDIGAFVPVTRNLALPKIISNATEDMLEEERATNPGYSNIRLCNGVVVGKDCFTVKLLNYNFSSVQQLYKIQFGKGVGGCQDVKPMRGMDAVISETRVRKLLHIPNAQGDPINPDDPDNGTPFVFTYVNKYGNSILTDNASSDHVFKQLNTVAKFTGRYWFSPEFLTQREYAGREYVEDDIKYEVKSIDVGDTSLADTFTAFDPLSAVASEVMPNDKYLFLGGDTDIPIDKDNDNTQTQLKGWDEEEPPDPAEDCSCERGTDNDFLDPANTARPSVSQWIDFLAYKIFPESNDPDNDGRPECKGRYEAAVEPMKPNPIVVSLASGGLQSVPGEENEYQLKVSLELGVDFAEGGKGWYDEIFTRTLGPLQFYISVEGGLEKVAPCQPKVIIENGIVTELIFENRGIFEVVAGEEGDLKVNIEPPTPAGGERNVFGVGVDDMSMDQLDSIRSSNYTTLQKQRAESCCCTDLDEGVVFIEEDDHSFALPETVKKQVARIANFTNVPIESRNNSTLVREAAFSNTDITFSTNLIPIGKLGGNPNDSGDELDWIVDQIELPGTFKERSYRVPISNQNPPVADNIDPRLICKYTKVENYKLKGQTFEAIALGIPHPIDSPPEDNPENVLVNDEITDCSGITMLNQVKGREMKIDFVTPSDEDLKVEIDESCGELEGEELEAKITEVKEKLRDFVRKRGFSQITPSTNCSVTIADVGLHANVTGAFTKFTSGAEGIPRVEDGLESLAIKVDANGIRVTIGISTKRKLRTLAPSNIDQWDRMNPRLLNNMVNDAAMD